jgi:O-antigen/teichoic acid export membrane protein
LAAIYAFCRLLHAVAGTWIIGRGGAGDAAAGRAEARAMLRKEAVSYATVFVLPLALFRMDVMMLGWLEPASTLGIYVAAMRLFSVGLVVPDGVLSAVFATLARLHGAGERAEFRRVLEQTALALGSLLVVAAAAGTLAAPHAIRLLFGEAFEASTPVLQILLWALPLFAWNRALGDALVATGHQRTVGGIVWVALGVALAAYPALIRAGGVAGAAWALVGVCVLIGGASAHFAVKRGLVNLFDLAVYALPLVCGLASQAAPTAGLRGAALALAAALTVWLCWTKLALPQRRAAATEAMTGVLPL